MSVVRALTLGVNVIRDEGDQYGKKVCSLTRDSNRKTVNAMSASSESVASKL